MTTTLKLTNIGPIKNAALVLSNLTVLVGPQASGKSIALQWLKLLLDTDSIHTQLQNYGHDWSGDVGKFLDLYFGEGMRSQWQFIWLASGKSVLNQQQGCLTLKAAISEELVDVERILIETEAMNGDRGQPVKATDYRPRLGYPVVL